jgi:lipid kinase YegS
MKAGRKIFLVVHGKVAGTPQIREAVELARHRGHMVMVRVTWEAGDGRELAREGVRAGADVVVAAGGDGMLNEVVNGVASCGLPARTSVGLIPLGTANDLANAAGIPLGDPVAAMKIITEGQPHLIDLGMLNERFFINMASGGYGTQVTVKTPEGMKSMFGGVSYLFTGLLALPTLVPQKVELTAPDWNWSGGVLVLAVGNGRFAGGGVPLCSRAQLDDGLLDVMVIPDVEYHELVSLLADLLRLHLPKDGTHFFYHQVRWLNLRAKEEFQINLDGEPVVGTEFHWSIQPRMLRFYLPPPASTPTPS